MRSRRSTSNGCVAACLAAAAGVWLAVGVALPSADLYGELVAAVLARPIATASAAVTIGLALRVLVERSRWAPAAPVGPGRSPRELVAGVVGLGIMVFAVAAMMGLADVVAAAVSSQAEYGDSVEGLVRAAIVAAGAVAVFLHWGRRPDNRFDPH